MKKVIIDSRMTENSGIGVFTSNILSRLNHGGDIAYSLIGRKDKLGKFGFPVHECGAGIYGLSEQLAVPRILRAEKPGLYHCTHYNVPLLYGGRMAVTIYDLIHLLYPDFLPSKTAYLYAAAMFRAAVRKASLIITISEHTRRDIVERLGAKESRIRLVYPAVGHEFMPSEEAARDMRARHGRYVLYVGAVRPHKNAYAAAEAFCLMKKEKKIEHKLLIAGKSKGDYLAGIRALMERHGLLKDLIHLENPDFETVRMLYRGADVFIFPSLYEGFGLPVLEAMASGCPVVCSNTSSLPEAAGSAAVTVDPLDPAGIAEAAYGILSDARLRVELVKKGFDQVKKFSWDRAAAETERIYGEALA